MAGLSGPRSLENAKDWMLSKLDARVHPVGLTDVDATRAVIAGLTGLDGASCSGAWSTQGDLYAAAAERAEAENDVEYIEAVRRLSLLDQGLLD
tara:strand:- start:893 stop:1174 length:282 start_codon:yes stop_codon:yes gene_type:complete